MLFKYFWIPSSCLPYSPFQPCPQQITPITTFYDFLNYLLCAYIQRFIIRPFVNQNSNSNVTAGRIELIIFVNATVIDYIMKDDVA